MYKITCSFRNLLNFSKALLKNKVYTQCTAYIMSILFQR